jgi:phosphopantothenoylcysteine decarboxylase / phosphopantothenate---cysteine ligase
MLRGKHIVIGITGSIAAYKSAALCRLFIKAGADVKVIMTPLAKEFITPVTLATLSKNTVLSDFFVHDSGQWNSHVDLGLWADYFIIAPCTANTIAKMANGIADNLLLTSYLSTRAKVFVAPAMDLDMFSHPATLRNMESIKSMGANIIEPASGELASGLEGKGRMEEPEAIFAHIENYERRKNSLAGAKILVTAGPTYEKIDPVRYIGNFSSGKMGYAIAEELAARGAEVVLVSGPVGIKCVSPGIKLINVTSAQEMFDASCKEWPGCKAAVLAAAVADYRPKEEALCKIKSSEPQLSIILEKNPDIAEALGKNKQPGQVIAGFALETCNEEANAADKMLRKNMDFIVLNSLNSEGAGFQLDTNNVTIISPTDKTSFPKKLKTEVAKDIVDKLTSKLL